MTTKRFYFVMIGLNILTAILVVGVVFWGNGLIDAQAKKLQEVKTEARLIDQQQISLVQAKKDIEKYTELNSIAKSIVPQDKDQAKIVRSVSEDASPFRFGSAGASPSRIGSAASETLKDEDTF